VQPTHLLDTHDHPVSEGVWELYRHAVARFGEVATLLERDDHIPPLEELCAESRRAAEIARQAGGGVGPEAGAGGDRGARSSPRSRRCSTSW
jgi:uncharacterized protein (UPF0276 family)